MQAYGPVADWLGWSDQRGVAVIRAVDDSTVVPIENETECYVTSGRSFDAGNLVVFATEPLFTLVSPAELYRFFDPTWERSGLETLSSMQERFWTQINRLQPETYLSTGGNDVAVSRN